ncbi:LexA family transcriptional regulator [Marinobacter sp. X15-166B]|uniref:LexA family transcriptional regulator n=1 Tax=Marinobacter sp. X15-166B TaxID=1897620 RepID=UPI001D17700E|nr:S24 family peptidase [Marinobacter sp. X15-166B]
MKELLGMERDKDIATYFGVNPQMIYNWKARGTIPLDQCVQLRFEKGVSLDWLLLGLGEGEVDEGYAYGVGDRDYTEIPVYDVEASAGNGAFFDHEQIVSHLKFRNDWLAREGLHAKDLAAIRVAGDSMDGSLSDGDTVLINRARTTPDGVFAIRVGDSLRIKRLQKMTDGSLRVSSDNEIYAPEVIARENLDQVDIIGHCHWRSGRVF